MNKIIGIDLGTSNSVVSVIEGGKSVVITNKEGYRTTPSIVSFAKAAEGERKVGELAKRQAIVNPEGTVYSVKSLMGKRYDQLNQERLKKLPYTVKKSEKGGAMIAIGDKCFSPQEISAMILQKLKDAAKEFLGRAPKKAVITVPAYFNDAERQATKEAGEIAGLEVVRIINEPTAAALAYGIDKKKAGSKIMVYDLGGGTFDVTALEIDEGLFEVRSTNGDSTLGGDDFDDAIITWLLDEFKKKEGIDLKKDPTALQRLKEEAEKAKKELSTHSETEINIPFITSSDSGPKHLRVTLSRSQFDRLTDALVERTIAPCKKALSDAGWSQADIDEVILVGGSTRIPSIQLAVKNLFGKEPSKSVNPDEVVAEGAAIQGGIINQEIKDVILLDVTPLSLGIETMGGVFTKLIEANTTIPFKKSQVFSTAQDNQSTVDIHVLQGERPMASDNRTIGRFTLEGIPAAPRGIPQIEVTFDIDVNGIVNVYAKDKGSGKEQKITIQASSNLSEDEIKRMKEEAAQYADQDKKKKEAIEKINKADALVFQAEKQLKEENKAMDEKEKKALEELVGKVKKAVEEKKAEEADTLAKELEKKLHALAMKIYQSKMKEKEQGKGEKKEESKENGTVKDADFEEVEEDKKS